MYCLYNNFVSLVMSGNQIHYSSVESHPGGPLFREQVPDAGAEQHPHPVDGGRGGGGHRHAGGQAGLPLPRGCTLSCLSTFSCLFTFSQEAP